MAVEEIVKENTPKAEGEAQGVKYISLTEEELERLIKAAGREGAKKGVEAYERRKEKRAVTQTFIIFLVMFPLR